MHLSSLYIDGYGPFEDSLISEFAEGLNLVVAEDETAAAALRDFIWSVIFGFEPGKNGKDGLNLLEAPNRGAAGGFLGFDSTDGPVTVARYRRLAPDHDKDAASDDAGLVTITGPAGSLDQIVGHTDRQKFKRLVQIDPREIAAFREVVRRQIADTFAQRAREAAEAESVLREAGGQINVPTIEEIMDEMRIARDYQVARVDNLTRSAKGIGRRLRGSRRRESRLKILTEVRPTWNTLLELRRQMADLPNLPDVSEDPIGRLGEVTANRTEAQAQLDSARAAEEAKSSELDGMRPTNEEAARHTEIHQLAAAWVGYDRQLEAIEDAEEEVSSAESKLESRLSELGDGWTSERVREFAANVDQAEIGKHDSTLQQAAEDLEAAQEENVAALTANAEATAEVEATQEAFTELGDIPSEQESELGERLTVLRSIKATVQAISHKKAAIADLHVKRSDARRLGSGVSRIVMQAQSIVSGGFLLVGLIVWSVATLASDNPVQRTGLVMMGAGITGVLFALMFLWLQRHPTFGRSVVRNDGSSRVEFQPAEDPKQSEQGAAGIWLWSSMTLLKGAVVALISVLKWIVTRSWARVAQARASKASKPKKNKSVAASAASESGAAEAGDVASSNDSAKTRSPFGIKEFIGKFIQIENKASESDDEAESESDSEEDDLLSAIADEITSEDEGAESAETETEVDEEAATAAMEEIEASVPEELRDAQERSESPKGIIGSLLARVLKSADQTDDQSDDEALGEMSEDGIWSASGQKRRPFPMRLVSSVLGSISAKRATSTPASTEDDDAEVPEEKAEGNEPAVVTADASKDESTETVADEELDEESDDDGSSEQAAEEEPAVDSASEPEAESAEPAEESGGDAEPAGESEDDETPATEAPAAEGEDAAKASDEPTTEAGEEPDATADQPAEAESESSEEIAAAAAETETENESADEVPAANAAEEPPVAETAPEETVYKFGDPIEALDEGLTEATKNLEALTREFKKLHAVYLESLGAQGEDTRLMMNVEMIDNAVNETSGRVAILHQAAQIESKLATLEEEQTASQTAIDEAEGQLQTATTASDAAREQWVQWLNTAGLETDLEPRGVRAIAEALEPIRVRISAVEILQEKLDGLQSQASDLEARVREAAGSAEHDDLYAAFGAIKAEAEAATSLRRRLDELEESLKALSAVTSAAEAELERTDSLLQATLKEIGADDESHYRELTAAVEKRRELSDEHDRMRIETPALTGPDAADLDEELESLPQEQVEAELAELPGHIDRLQAQLASIEQDLTRAETELAGMPEMPGDESEDESSANASRHEGMPMLLRRPLGRTALQAATRNLERFTDGKYRGLSMMASEDGGSIVGYKVVDANGNVDDPEESDAASVFMALRVAQIEAYLDSSASVPAAILDVPVADDSEISQAVLAGVIALSEHMQVVCISSDPAASGRYAAAAKSGQVNLVDAVNLASPFRKVSGEG